MSLDLGYAVPPTSTPLEPIYLHLPITDPESITFLSESPEGRDRQELALTALKIGILSLKAARGTVDGTAIRHEGERLIGTLEERLAKHRELLDDSMGATLRSYFDPSSGAFTERVQRLLRADGDLATVIARQVDAAQCSLDALLTQHLGEDSALRALLSPDEGNAFIGAVRCAGRASAAVAVRCDRRRVLARPGRQRAQPPGVRGEGASRRPGAQPRVAGGVGDRHKDSALSRAAVRPARGDLDAERHRQPYLRRLSRSSSRVTKSPRSTSSIAASSSFSCCSPSVKGSSASRASTTTAAPSSNGAPSTTTLPLITVPMMGCMAVKPVTIGPADARALRAVVPGGSR